MPRTWTINAVDSGRKAVQRTSGHTGGPTAFQGPVVKRSGHVKLHLSFGRGGSGVG